MWKSRDRIGYWVLWFFCLLSLLALAISPLHSEQIEKSTSLQQIELPVISDTLPLSTLSNSLSSNSLELVRRLIERNLQIKTLQTNLQKVGNELANWQIKYQLLDQQLQGLQVSAKQSQVALTETSNSLDSLQQSHKQLKIELEDYKTSVQKERATTDTAIRKLSAQVNIWRGVGITVSIGFAVVGAYAVYKFGHDVAHWW